MAGISKLIAVVIACASLVAAGCERNLAASTRVAVKPKPSSTAEDQSELLQSASGLFDAVRIGGEMIIAVGRQGEILRSEDGGKVWRRVSSSTSGPLLSVAFSDNEHGVIVGTEGAYLESADGGRSWTARSIGIHDNLFVIRFFEHKTGFILGAFGTLLQSEDAGKSWRAIELNWDKLLPELSQTLGLVQPHLYGITFSDPLHGWVVGEYGLVLGTEDGGKTWHKQSGGGMADRQLFAVVSVAAGKVVAAGQGGEIVYSADYGNHWATSLPPDGLDVYGLVPLGSNAQLLALGDLGSAFVSTDGGRPDSWHSVNLARGPAAVLANTWLAAAVPERDDILAFGQLGIWRLALDSAGEPPG